MMSEEGIAKTLGVLIAGALVVLMVVGWLFLRDRSAESDERAETTRAVLAPSASPTPEPSSSPSPTQPPVTPAPTPTPTPTPEVSAAPTTHIDVLEAAVLLPDDVSPLGYGLGDLSDSDGYAGTVDRILLGGLGSQLTFCEYNEYDTSPFEADEIYSVYGNQYGSGMGYGSAVVSYRENAAPTIFERIQLKAQNCTGSLVVSTDEVRGRPAVRVSESSSDGYHRENMFVLMSDHIVQVGLFTRAGDRQQQIRELADLSVAKLERAYETVATPTPTASTSPERSSESPEAV